MKQFVCSFVRATVNDTSHKAGGVNKNVAGCSSSGNPYLSVPGGYLGLRVSLRQSSGGLLCGQQGYFYNSGTASSITVTTGIARGTACYRPEYYGQAEGLRWSRYEGIYYGRTVYSPVRPFIYGT